MKGSARPSILTSFVVAAASFVSAIASFHLLEGNPRVLYDEQNHHLPAIRDFARQLPRPDLQNYAVATTPGYHLAMASAVRYFGFREPGLRSLNIAFSMGLAAAVGCMITRRIRLGEAVALAMPLVLCVYVVTSAAWILPENAAWAFVAIILSLALLKTTRKTLLLMSVALLLLVLVRQAHAWCAVLIVVAAAVDASGRRDQLVRIGTGLAASLPAIVVVAGFVLIWGGLVPPLFQPGGQQYEQSSQYGGWGPAAGAFTLALAGILGTPLVPWLWRAARGTAGRQFWVFLFVGAIVGSVLSIIPETSYQPAHRRSGIWRLIEMTPVIGERSPLLIGLATLGGAVAAVAMAAQTKRTCIILLTTLVAFILAQTANPMIWQRYYEPMVLLWLIVAVAYAQRPAPARLERWLQWIGLIGLTLFQIAVTLYTLRGGAE